MFANLDCGELLTEFNTLCVDCVPPSEEDSAVLVESSDAEPMVLEVAETVEFV